jgi:hypothetical protein
MTTADISAVYEFLRALPPVDGPTGDAPFRKGN